MNLPKELIPFLFRRPPLLACPAVPAWNGLVDWNFGFAYVTTGTVKIEKKQVGSVTAACR